MKSSSKPSCLVSLCFLAFFTSCSTNSKPSTSSLSDPPLETIAILGTNDIHGSLTPFSFQTRDSKGSLISFEAGGAATITSYVKILRKEFGNRLIWLDAGDEFQGSIESNSALGAPMVQFFNASGLHAAAVGNHEFDFGLDALKGRMQEARYSYLAANIYDANTNELASFPNTKRHMIFQAGKLKVGVIGLSTLQTPTTTKAANVSSLRFEDLRKATLQEAQALREQGANVVLLTAHAGSKCDLSQAPRGRMIRSPSDQQGECSNTDEIVQLLQSLPENTLDGVVSGHTHQIVHHWIAGVPVIQAGAFGRYLNVIYLSYDWNQKKVLPEQTRIEGPIPVCTHVFQHQNDCDVERPAPKQGRGPLVPYKFHGETIQPDAEITALLKPIFKKSESIKKRKIGTAVHAIDHPRQQESSLGNLVADAMRIAAQSDFAYINSGGLRTPLQAGNITYGDIFRVMPFDNEISVLRVNRDELKKILQVALSGSRGFGSISGLKVKLIDPHYEAPFHDLNGDGKMDLWKINRLLEVTFPDGTPLDPNKIYTLATLDFLVTGGDDLKWPMSQIPAERIFDTHQLVRNAVMSHIEKAQLINSNEHPLVDVKHPRLQFEKPKSKGKGKGRAKSRRSRKTHTL